MARLTAAARRDRARAKRHGTPPTSNQKVLASILDHVYTRVPADPGSDEYRQGKTLGPARAHWRRAKFGAGRFRLFFRYASRGRIIIFAWVNDRETLRTYGARTDAYAVFRRMLDRGHPPDDWDALLAEASAPAVARRSSGLLDAARVEPRGTPPSG